MTDYGRDINIGNPAPVENKQILLAIEAMSGEDVSDAYGDKEAGVEE